MPHFAAGRRPAAPGPRAGSGRTGRRTAQPIGMATFDDAFGNVEDRVLAAADHANPLEAVIEQEGVEVPISTRSSISTQFRARWRQQPDEAVDADVLAPGDIDRSAERGGVDEQDDRRFAAADDRAVEAVAQHDEQHDERRRSARRAPSAAPSVPWTSTCSSRKTKASAGGREIGHG